MNDSEGTVMHAIRTATGLLALALMAWPSACLQGGERRAITAQDGLDALPDVSTPQPEVGTPDPDIVVPPPELPPPEVTPPDPCDPNPCTTPTPPHCGSVGNTATVYGVPGTCTASNGAVTCKYPVVKSEFCPAGTKCDSGSCVPDDTNLYVPTGQASFVHAMRLPEPGEPPCCGDLDGDGTIDNVLGEIFLSLQGLIGNVTINELLQEAIADGTVTNVLEFVDLSPGLNDPSVIIRSFEAESLVPFELSSQGLGEFVIPLSNFVPGSFEPISTMPASVNNGLLLAGPGELVIPFPLLPTLEWISVPAFGEITAEVKESAALGPVLQGQVVGAVPLTNLAAALNAYVDDNCQCLNVDGPMVSLSSPKKLSCKKGNPSSPCSEACTGFNSFCGVMSTVLQPDIDANGDAFDDSMSIGFTFQAVPATIIGVTD